MEWIYLSVVLLMRIVQRFLSKYNSLSLPKNSISYLKYTVFYLVFAAILAFGFFGIEYIIDPKQIIFNFEVVGYALMSALGLTIGCLCSQYALSKGEIVLVSLFGTAGLLVPTITSIFLYDEKLSILQWLFVALFLVGAYLITSGSSKRNKFNFKMLIILIIILLSEGITMLGQTMFGRNIVGGNVSLFSVLLFVFGSLFLAIAYLIIYTFYNKNKKNNIITNTEGFEFIPGVNSNVKLVKQTYIFAIFLAVAVFIINQFVTLTTPLMSPVILFAIVNGGNTIIGAIVGAAFFKEKLNISSIIGLVLGLSSLILIKLFAL